MDELKQPTNYFIVAKWLSRLDWWLIISFLLLMIFSFITVNTASLQDSTLERQIYRYLFAWVVFIFILFIPGDFVRRYTPLIYVMTLMILALVLLVGTEAGGARRWLDLGFIKLQPSEIAKITVPMMVAWYLTKYQKVPTLTMFINALLIILAPMGLIILEPDLGTALLVAMSGCFALFLSGLRYKYFFIGIIIAIVGLTIFWNYGMHDYQRLRVLTLLNPEADPRGAGYHIIQSKIAIGSGGIMGKGYSHGTQAALAFLPESNTDFIFSVYAEELGLIGVAILLSIYAFIVLRGIYLSTILNNRYARIVTACIFTSFFVNVFVNIGMVSGFLPVVGLPLALISYGGSSIISLMAAFGLAINLCSTYRTYTESDKI